MLFMFRRGAVFTLALLWGAIAEARLWQFDITGNDGAPLPNAVMLLPGMVGDPSNTSRVMDQVNRQFLPQVLVIRRGEQVSFPNSDNIRHHVYSFSDAKTFEIKLYSGVPGAPITFDQTGVVVLGCNIHDGMVGYIVVADTVYTGVADAGGHLSVEGPATLDRVRVWHPAMAAGAQPPLELALPSPASDGTYAITLPVHVVSKPERKVTFGERFQSDAR